MTRNLLKATVDLYIASREPYMQASFQRTYDNGNACDHTHQMASVVRAGIGKGKIFTASYTVMSLHGLVNLNRMTYTKGMAEISGLLDDYKEARSLVSAPTLDHWASDATHVDGPTWNRKFADDLKRGVVPYSGPSRNLPQLGIEMSNVVYLSSIDNMDRVALAMLAQYSGEEDIVYGLDAEWCWGDSGINLLIVSMPETNDVEINKVKLFDLNAAGAQSINKFPKNLRTFLEQANYIPTGVNVGNDVTRLHLYGVKVTRYYELIGMAKQLNPDLSKYKMENLAEYFLKASVDKTGQRGDYDVSPLPWDLQKYAAIDGAVSRKLFEVMSKQLRSHQIETVVDEPLGLSNGDIATLYISGENVARVSIVQVGKCDMTVKWGSAVVKPGKAIISLDEVYFPSVRPPISYKKNVNNAEDEDWNRSNVNLQDLSQHNKTILVHTSSLVVTLPFGPSLNSANPNEQLTTTSTNITHDSNASSSDPILTFSDNVDDPNEDDAPRNRQKTDMFHRFKALPVDKSDPRRPTVSKLLMHASLKPDIDDYVKLQKRLEPKMSHKPCDGDKYIDEIMNIYFHKREWWKQRCRMYTLPAIEHAQRMQQVIDIIQSDEVLLPLYDDDLEKYFKSFMDAIVRGEFEELRDVNMFINYASDSHGLDLYYRMKGTVRAENLHNKMNNAVGNWGIGARTAHMLLVLLCYRYNVSGNIRRCGGHNFGHSELYLIDRIQKRVQELYNVLIWPKHKNVMDFKGKPNFISVGIGPLCFDEKYVEFADEPAAHLIGDLHFVAKQQGLKYPLHQVNTEREIKCTTISWQVSVNRQRPCMKNGHRNTRRNQMVLMSFRNYHQC